MKKYVIFVFVLMLATMGFVVVGKAQSVQNKEEKAVEKIKKTVTKIAKKDNKRVKINLKNGTKVFGYIKKVDNNSFEVVQESDNQTISLEYKNIDNLRMKEKNETKTVLRTVGILGFFLVLFPLAL